MNFIHFFLSFCFFICAEDFGKFDLVAKIATSHNDTSNVYIVRDPVTKESLVIKSLLLKNIKNYKNMGEILMLDFQKKKTSPYLVRTFDYFIEKDTLYIIMEYCAGGNLKEWVTQRKKIKEKHILHIFAQIVEGVSFLHDNGFLHLDIKPQNVLFTDLNESEVKIGDFGSVHNISQLTPKTRAGRTRGYSSPVGIEHNLSAASDVYSIGCTMYFAMTKKRPFKDVDNNSTPVGLPRRIKGKYSDELKNLVYSMLSEDQKKRPTVAELKQHPVLREMIEKVEKLQAGGKKKKKGKKGKNPEKEDEEKKEEGEGKKEKIKKDEKDGKDEEKKRGKKKKRFDPVVFV